MATILILGAYGFIGAEVTRACIANGHQVQVFGRDADQLTRLGAAQIWCRDLRDMLAPGDWSKVLSGVEIIVNAAGVLQDGPRDDVDRVQRLAIAAMAKAADQAGVRRIVQISAVGADAKADTAFMATKGMADRVLLDGPVEVIVLRPGLVLGRSVYGGTALLRMLAAVPVLQPIAFGDARVQTVAMDDVVSAVDHAVSGRLEGGRSYDLVAEDAISLQALVTAMRDWLGFPEARWTLRIGDGFAHAVSHGADLLGQLGWRSPLRSSAMRALRNGVTGDASAWREAGLPPCRSLEQTLAATPSTLQDRVQARMSLMMPMVVGILSVFWLLSGGIGVLSFDEATRILIYRGFPDHIAWYCVGAGVVADLALGLSVLVRRWARGAMLGMVAVSLGYLLAGSLWTPDLWADPLGPFVKVLPAAMLAAVGYFMLDRR